MSGDPSERNEQPLRVIELDCLRVPYAVDERKREDEARRLLTLLQPRAIETHVGGTAKAIKVFNSFGETFCLKALKRPKGFADREDERARAFEIRSKALSFEYCCQSALRGIPGIPLVCGYGLYAGGPVMLMEWVRGISLREALLPRATTLKYGLSIRTLSALGAQVASILCAARARDRSFAHRDLSGANILVETDKRSLNQQVSDGDFELRLIDFGSAVCSGIAAEREGADPNAERIWRNATPEYAPPEMLSHHTKALVSQRDSESIDVYELCGVLFELYCGATPYRLAASKLDDAFRFKTEHAVAAPHLRRPQDRSFVELILQGLERKQPARPSLSEFRHRMLEICRENDDALATAIAASHERALSSARIAPDPESTDLTRG